MGRGWGAFRFGGREKTSCSDWVAAPERVKARGLRASFWTGLVQSCGLERLVNVAALASDSLGDLSDAHSSLAQRHDARGRKWPGGPYSLSLCGVDARALTIADEAELHLSDPAQHS
jgi:hypothetical protein